MSSANCPGRFRWGLTHPSVHRHAFGARSLNLGLSRALGRLDNTRTIDARGHDSRVVVHVGGALPVRVVPLFQSIVYASGSLVQLLNAVAFRQVSWPHLSSRMLAPRSRDDCWPPLIAGLRPTCAGPPIALIQIDPHMTRLGPFDGHGGGVNLVP